MGNSKISKPLTMGAIFKLDTKGKVDDLPIDAQVLFGFLKLLVNIRYRQRYGSLLEGEENGLYDGKSNKQLYSKDSMHKREKT
jgi:hypothetical protein